jgi:hypothetical protein
MSVRFGDKQPTVMLDGGILTDCYEVKAGPGGCAWRWCVPTHQCDCGSGRLESYLDRSDGYTIHRTTRFT